MLLAWLEPDHIAWSNGLNRAALPRHEARARRDDEGLPERVGVPRRAGAGLERDRVAGVARRGGRAEEGADPDGPGKLHGWALAERERAAAGAVHGVLVVG